MRYAPNAVAEQLERHLGDPWDGATTFSFAHCADLDAREEFPEEICRGLERWGIQRYYVPAKYGGDLASYEHALQLMRVLARRDLTVAIGHGKTFLGSVCSWVAGRPDQAEWLAEQILAGVPVSWGLTEQGHGSDLLAGETRAEWVSGGYRISGEKWLINNATRGQIVSLLARTSAAGGPRGFDVILVDKRELDADTYHCLPKVRTHGIRGADISGIVFTRALVPPNAVVGTSGAGLETVLKCLQLTRTMVAALSLGAGDQALRLVFRFAGNRRLYGRRLIDLPRARRTLLDAYADHLLAEAVAIVAARSIHALTDELSVASAVVKYLVPSRADAMVADLARLLGARSFVVDTPADGVFQKIQRDHRIVALFDGHTLVNLNVIINHFPVLARGYRTGAVDSGWPTVFDLGAPLPDLDAGRLQLVARRGSSVLQAMPALLAQLEGLAAERQSLRPAFELAGRVARHCETLHAELARQRPARTQVPPVSFALAERYALCHAASAALGLWLHTRPHVTDGVTAPIWHDAHWLRAVLTRVLTTLGESPPVAPETDETLLGVLAAQEGDGYLLSLLPCRLGENESR